MSLVDNCLILRRLKRSASHKKMWGAVLCGDVVTVIHAMGIPFDRLQSKEIVIQLTIRQLSDLLDEVILHDKWSHVKHPPLSLSLSLSLKIHIYIYIYTRMYI